MQKLTCVIFGLLAAATCAAQASAGDGITASPEQLRWSRWQGRMTLAAEPSGLRLNAVSLMGDYYFSGSFAGSQRVGGFRATSGLMVGPRTQSWLGQPGLSSGSALSIGSQAFGQAAAQPSAGDTPIDTGTLPYLGLGYTGLSLRGGWNFNADLGLLARNPGNVVTFGRSQSLDDKVHELRVLPVLQFGASYSF